MIKPINHVNKKGQNAMKLVFTIVILISLTGCASSNIPGLSGISFRKDIIEHKDWPEETLEAFKNAKFAIGMTQEQIFILRGSPTSWSRHVISGDEYDVWFYHAISPGTQPHDTFSFKNKRLTGYSYRGELVTESGSEDLRDYATWKEDYIK